MSRFTAAVLATISLFIAATDCLAAIGTVTEQSGPTEIQRDKKSIPSNVSSEVEMNDTVVTAKSKTRITFKDESLVEITEQSKLLIDDFVYEYPWAVSDLLETYGITLADLEAAPAPTNATAWHNYYLDVAETQEKIEAHLQNIEKRKLALSNAENEQLGLFLMADKEIKKILNLILTLSTHH